LPGEVGSFPKMKIGVLALQGDFIEHQLVFERLGSRVVQVRFPAQLKDLNGLIIPGGESTTIGKLSADFKLIEPLHKFGERHAVWGTCAGAILLSKLKLMDIVVERNAFGRQVDSFGTNLEVKALKKVDSSGRPFHAIFIRAPLIKSVGKNVKVLARLPKGEVVAAREGKLLATSFHPELTDDDRFHRYFLELAGF
jgi:5'-phosphate synthase pdxT subunit